MLCIAWGANTLQLQICMLYEGTKLCLIIILYNRFQIQQFVKQNPYKNVQKIKQAGLKVTKQ